MRVVVRREVTAMLRRIAIILALVFLVALPATAQDFQKGLTAVNRGDYAAALREWRALAAKGHASAQHYLGIMYDKGLGVLQDHGKAVKWYRKAAEQGSVPAQLSLGICYSQGRGVPQDYVLAYMWLSLGVAKENKNVFNARDILANRMTPSQIAKAQKLAREWWTKHKKK